MSVEITWMDLEDVIGAEYNPRVTLTPGDPRYERLKRSIEEFGFVDPLVWNSRTRRLVGGHQRLEVLRDLNYDRVQVVVVDEPEDRERALNVALNAAKGDWDMERLRDVLMAADPIVYEVGMTEMDLDTMEREMGLSSPTDFLAPILDMGDKVGPGAAELRADHPHRTGQQYFEIVLVLTGEQRDLYVAAINQAKRMFDTNNSMEAIVHICENFLREGVAT